MSSRPREVAPLGATAAMPADAPAPMQPSSSAPAEAAPPQASLADILAAAPDAQAFALIRDGEPDAGTGALIVSAMSDDGHGASCRKAASSIRCIDFAGYDRRHLIDVLDRTEFPSVPTPAWVPALFAKVEAAAKPHEDLGVDDAVSEIEVHLDEAGPVLMIVESYDVRFAIRRDRSWRVSAAKSGGRTIRPFYFGSIDTTRATTTPSLGIVIGSYSKEGCVRSETIELVVMDIAATELVDRGSVEIGEGAWIQGDRTFGLFDPADPDHYRIQLRPRVQHDGRIRFEIESRHTPQSLRKRPVPCGVDPGLDHIDSLIKLVGSHALRDVLRTDSDEVLH